MGVIGRTKGKSWEEKLCLEEDLRVATEMAEVKILYCDSICCKSGEL